MFNFLSLFKRNRDEQLIDNNYDFNEIPVSENDIKGIVENKTPVLSGTTSAKKGEPRVSSPNIDADRQEASDKADLEQVREKLRAITGKSGTRSEGVDTGEVSDSSREEEAPFDINGKTLLGKGGENFVYDIPDDPSVVGRVAIEPLIDQLTKAEGQPGTEETSARETLQAKLAAENATYDELCTYFGNEHVPQTTRSVRQVPTSREFLEAIHKAKGRAMPEVTQLPTDMLTIVATQEKVPEINDNDTVDIQGGLAEARDPKTMNTEDYKKAYGDVTQALVCDPESASFDLDQFLVIHPALRATVEQAHDNPQLKASLTDFVQRAMRYSKETGKSLDLFGPKNILFFENTDGSNTDSAWGYKLVDALPPSNQQKALESTEGLMKKVIAKEPIEDHLDRLLLRCAVNYQRTLNGLAKELGVEDHLDMIPHASTITPSEFWDVLYDGGPPASSSKEQEERAA